MTVEMQRATIPTTAGYGIVQEQVELIEDAPTEEFSDPYTIIMPRPLNEIRLRRQFVKGRCVVYDPEVAREFQTNYGYAVEPDLPEPEPVARKQTPRRYIKD